MKKIFLCLLLVAVIVPLSASAAKPSGNKTRIDQIKKAYANAQQLIAMGEEEPNLINQFTVDVTQMLPGSGPHKELLTVYFTLDEPDDPEETGEIWVNNLYFARCKYNYGAPEYNEEFLFDEKTGELMFYVVNFPADDGTTGTHRYYFENEKIIKTIPEKIDYEKGTFTPHVDFILPSANRIKSLFESLIGHSH